MSANLATNAEGTAAFVSLREIPWHNQGVVVQEEMPGLEFLQVAGLDFDVETFKLRGDVTLKSGETRVVDCPKLGVYRKDTGAVMPETVGEGFELYQNREIIGFFDGLVKDHKIVYECAGALGVGEEVWVLAHIPDLSMAIRGDENRTYMLIRNGHCGNSTLQCFPTTIRVVCANTMAMATFERSASGEKWGTSKGGYAIRHTRNMRDVVKNVQRAYEQVLANFAQQKELYEFLASKPVTEETKKQFLTWFALQGRDESRVLEAYRAQSEGKQLGRGDKSMITRFESTLETLEKLYESPTNQQPGTRNTVYSTLQTIIEFVDHERTTRCGQDEDCEYKRFESAIFGSGSDLKTRATLRALELALAV